MSAIADRYRRLADALTATVDAVPEDAWSLESPCAGWTALDVLAHVVATQWEHLERVGFPPEGVTLPDDPREAWPVVRREVEAVLDDRVRAGADYESYFGRTTVEASFDQFYASDLVIHRWDLARATGLTDHETMPADEPERLLGFYGELGDNVRHPSVFGHEVEVPADADTQTRLLGFVGRQP